MQTIPEVHTNLPATDLGYFFEASGAGAAHDHYRLTAWLRSQPTSRHYDPESITCRTITSQHTPENFIIRHPTPEAQNYPLAFGLISMSDRKGKKIEALTFGGTLEIRPSLGMTTCRFESPVPILALLVPYSLAERLACEIESIVAQCRAQWDNQGKTQDFEMQLGQLTPDRLYAGCLISAQTRIRTIQHPDEDLKSLQHFIETSRQQMQATGRWPAEARSLQSLLELD